MKIIESSGKFYESIMEIIIKIKDKRLNVHPKYGLIQEQEMLLCGNHQVIAVLFIFFVWYHIMDTHVHLFLLTTSK